MTYGDTGLTTDRAQRQSVQLSPSIVYYIRKLLRQNLDRLQFVVALGAGIRADHFSDLNVVLQSLYPAVSDVHSAVLDLERLTLSHQALSNQSSIHRQELMKLEQQIFWLLGFKQQELKQQGKILLVDDNPDNLRLLSSSLAHQGYDVRSAISGSMALSGVRSIMPDLVLLDVMMPGMNGYEVCEQLKADVLTQNIPVIFVSANDEALDKVKAFQVGGVDYITKPFQIEEVLIRVEHQLSICSLKKRLESQNVRLQQELRSRELQPPGKAMKVDPRPPVRPIQESHLPHSLAQPIADRFDPVTLLCADVLNFTAFCSETPTEAVHALNQIFSIFDHLVEQHGLVKIKAIGSSYSVAGGLLALGTDSTEAIADLALAMQQVFTDFSKTHSLLATPLRLRVGLHMGAAIAVVNSMQQPSYDLWGSTIDVAHQIRTESTAGRTLVTGAASKSLGAYLLEPRGIVSLNDQGETMTYWLIGRNASPQRRD